MPRHHKPKAFWRLARIWFRHVRITVWLLILLLLLVVLYLHNIGFPGFAQRAVIRSFEARGAVLDFSQLQLAWFEGVVARDVSLRPIGTDWVPQIKCRKVDLGFDPVEALRLRIVPRSLSITDGQLILPYPQTNGRPGQLTATNLQAQIRFKPGMGITLDSLKGEISGCGFSASGNVANPALIQDWRILKMGPDQRHGPAHEVWRTISQIRDELDFPVPPELRFGFEVDGAAPQNLSLWLSVRAEVVSSPWGLVEKPEVFARLRPMGDEVCSVTELQVQASRVSSRFGRGDDLQFETAFTCLAESGNILAGHASLSAHRLDTLRAGAVGLDVSLDWRGDATNRVPDWAELHLGAAEVSTSSGWAQEVQARMRLAPFTGDHRLIADLPRFIADSFEAITLEGSLTSAVVETPWLSGRNLELAGAWSCPEMSVTNLSVDLAGGRLRLGAGFNAISGRLDFSASSDSDVKRLYPALPQEAIDWLDFFTWEQAPKVSGIGSVTLPQWRPYQLLWPGNLAPSLHLNGNFEVGPGTYRRIPLSGASSHFTYSNMFWHLPDLTVHSPEGILRLEHHNNDRTTEFIWRIDGAINPMPALILIPDDAVETLEVLGTLRFDNPPEVHLELSGRWNDLKASTGWGTVRVVDMAFRGQSIHELDARLGLTNLILTVHEPHARTSEGEARASSLTFNLLENQAYLSNGVSTLPPMAVATAIGADVIQAIQPYRFLKPPNSRVEGVIPLSDVAEADLRFELQGGPFEWMNFHLSTLDARVHWRGETVAIDILDSGFYDGAASGKGFFDFTGKTDADFWFNLQAKDADLQPLVAGVFQSTNRLEGRLSGGLSITNANTGDLQSWFGYGHANLRDGFLWSAPIFGIVSPVLNMFVPGLGNSRAEEAAGRFTITNSVIRTDDLVIHTSNMRLLYSGTVDFQGVVNAAAEAEILRDTVLVGEIVSLALTPLSKAMIIELTGTLADPKARPLYLVPRVLLAPLSPMRFFKELFAAPAQSSEKFPTSTSPQAEPAPPGEPGPP